MIVATCGVASGAVLPHDQLESATATMVVSVRPILDMSALRRSSVPSRALNFAVWRPRTSALNRSIRSAVPSVHDYRDRTALPTGQRRLGRDRDGSRPLPGHDPRRRHRRGVDVGARPEEALIRYGVSLAVLRSGGELQRGSRLHAVRRRRNRDGCDRPRSDGDGRDPDFPSAFAATCDVPTASAVTTPSAEMLTIFGSCTVQVMAAPGTLGARCILHLRLQWKLGVDRERRDGWAHDDRRHLRCRVGCRATARPARQRDQHRARQRESGSSTCRHSIRALTDRHQVASTPVVDWPPVSPVEPEHTECP